MEGNSTSQTVSKPGKAGKKKIASFWPFYQLWPFIGVQKARSPIQPAPIITWAGNLVRRGVRSGLPAPPPSLALSGIQLGSPGIGLLSRHSRGFSGPAPLAETLF